MSSDKEELILSRRFMDLADTASKQGNYVFSDFLNLNEQSIFLNLKHELPKIKYFSFGGYQDAERKMLCFYNDNYINNDEIGFPIDIIKIQPLNRKYSDKLTHRDFLGAILSLGIDRAKIGDILIQDNEGYLFSTDKISEFIVRNLTMIKRTMVEANIIVKDEFSYKPKFEEKRGSVSSIRLDSILSVACKGSRSSLSNLIKQGKVFVNSKVILSNSYVLEENDLVSVRGVGKFIYLGILGKSKKGRYIISVKLYI